MTSIQSYGAYPYGYQNGNYQQRYAYNNYTPTYEQNYQTENSSYADVASMSEAEKQAAILAGIKAQNTQATQQAQSAQDAQCADGKDDGSIGFWGATKNFFKGVGNFFKGMVCDENGNFSLKRTFTTLAVTAGAIALSVATGGAAVPFLIGAGVAMGTVQVGKGIYNACTAKTDREAEAAWQDIGSGTTGVALSVAGARGALKSAGMPIPKGNMLTSSLRATGECLKISGKGIMNASKSMLHPVKTAKSINTYWANTMKPNLAKGFGWKATKNNYEANSNKGNISRAYEDQIKNVEAQLYDRNGNIIQNAETARLQNLRNQLYDAYDSHLNNYNSYIRRNIIAKENYIAGLKEQLKTATGENKTQLQNSIKESESLLKTLKTERHINLASERVTLADNRITTLKNQLSNATTEAQKAQIQSQINAIENAVSNNKNFLRITNAKSTIQQQLPQNGPAIAACYLSGAQPQTMNEYYAQMYGFESLAQMQEVAAQNGINAEQLANYLDAQYAAQGTTASQVAQAQQIVNEQAMLQEQVAQQQLAQQEANQQALAQQTQNTYNQYAQQNPFMMPHIPNTPTMDFNSLYVSPYPQMV